MNQTRRLRRCGHCGETGHDRRNCPSPEMVERRRQQRNQRNQTIRRPASNESEQVVQLEQESNTIYFYNNNSYKVVLFWKYIGGDILSFACINDPFTSGELFTLKNIRIVVIPYNEFRGELATQLINNPMEVYLTGDNQDYFITSVFDTDEYIDKEKIIYCEYNPPKSEIDQWKECALKSLFLLKEIERMGGKQYENIEPILDMVQDIPLPTHNELDKEQAGVPSEFTNIT